LFVKNAEHEISKNIEKASFDEAFFCSTETFVHPTAIIGSSVSLGTGVKIGPFTTITGTVTIGDNTRISPYVSIGFPAQNIGVTQSFGTIEIGKNCDIREFASIHASKYEEGKTVIGNSCYIMCHAHVAHDCILEDNVTLINNVNLGGHTHVCQKAIVMASSATHQFCKIGRLTALAPFSGIRQDLPPFCLFSGQPARYYGLNVIGLKRAGFSADDINALKHVAKLFYGDKCDLQEIIALVAKESWSANSVVQEFITFIQQSSRGVARKAASDGNVQEQENIG
jgi:UDP-N-acetylglucosamine acyltransferase